MLITSSGGKRLSIVSDGTWLSNPIVIDDKADRASLAALLQEKGTTFVRSYASFPLCCPSRASFLTGQYAHNHGVLDNEPPLGGYPAFEQDVCVPNIEIG